jgi:hypothetical protein
MNSYQQIIVSMILLYSFSAFLLGIKNRKNPFGLSKLFLPISVFVWVDAVVFGFFFTLVSLFSLAFHQWILFWLMFAVFWAIRSIGEQVYWFLEQFTQVHRNPPHTLWPHKWFKGQETWIVMQIFWQCISVVSIIFSVYLFHLWL